MTNQTIIAGLLGVSAVLAVVFGKKKSLLYPLAVNRVTSAYGTRTHPITKEVQFHNGIDLAANVGTVVAAPGPGIVTSINTHETGGNQLLVKHDNGYTSGYAHLSRYAVKVGDRVAASQIIAYTGATGRVSGPHLHFTLRNPAGAYVNPVNYLV